MYQLPKIVKEELDFFNTGDFIKINIFEDGNIQKIENFLENRNRLIIVSVHESLASQKFYDEIVYLKSKTKKDIRISCATASKFPLSTHPLTNIIAWKNAKGRFEIDWLSDNALTFDDRFTLDYKWKNHSIRSNKSILSVRKHNDLRDYLFENLDMVQFDGIVRYAKWVSSYDYEDDVLRSTVHQFPNIYELHNEYRDSYVAFAVETEIGDTSQNFTSTFTEKTMFPFANGNLPIILGSRNLISDLKEIGFTLFNDYFGFDEADYYTSYSNHRIDKFIEIINKVNNIPFNEIQKLWLSNLDKIQKNYDIIASILFNKKYDNYFYK